MAPSSTQAPIIPVLVIGAGISGIALGTQLRSKLNLPASDIKIFERQSDIGGTWHINRYPGVACDVPALFYSFSFAPNPKWTSLFPYGEEIVTYLREIAQRYGVAESVVCDADVGGCVWDEEEKVWVVKIRYLKPGMGDLSWRDRSKLIDELGVSGVIEREETVKAKTVCSCVGGLVEPNHWPKGIEGFDDFEGSMFHSARWDYNVDLKDKDVVVIGTGCSAAQFVPRLSKEYGAKSVTQLMRSPPWVEPRIAEPGGPDGYKNWAPFLFTYVPGLMKLARFSIFANAEYAWSTLFVDGKNTEKNREKYEANLLDHLKRTTPEKYHDMLTPDYGVGCKRRIFDAAWLPSLHDPKVELTTMPLKSVKTKSVILGPGGKPPKSAQDASTGFSETREIPADVIVLANGFETTRWLHPLQVTGRNGVDLHKEMDARGGSQAYQGTAMDGFPNFFIIFGPNTATGHTSVVLASENMIIYALQFIKLVLNNEASTVEVKHEAEVDYTTNCQEALKHTVFNNGCQNWYITNGWNSVIYPYSQPYFIYRSYFPKWSDWTITYTRKGQWLRRARAIAKIGILSAVLYLSYRLRKPSDRASLVRWLRGSRQSLQGIAAKVVEMSRSLTRDARGRLAV